MLCHGCWLLDIWRQTNAALFHKISYMKSHSSLKMQTAIFKQQSRQDTSSVHWLWLHSFPLLPTRHYSFMQQPHFQCEILQRIPLWFKNLGSSPFPMIPFYFPASLVISGYILKSKDPQVRENMLHSSFWVWVYLTQHNIFQFYAFTCKFNLFFSTWKGSFIREISTTWLPT